MAIRRQWLRSQSLVPEVGPGRAELGRCLGLGERGLGKLFVIRLSISHLKITHEYTA